LRAAAVLGLPAALAAQNPKTQPASHKPEPTSAPITAADLKTRLYIYAADSMEGRETGTRGHIKATNYIAAQLKTLGLKPMGDNGTYFQNVPVIRRALDPSSTQKIEELLYELKRELTIIIVTHNLQQAARASDYTAFFFAGELVEFRQTEQLFTSPREDRTDAYITGRFG